MFGIGAPKVIDAGEVLNAEEQRISGARGEFTHAERRKLLPGGSKVFLILLLIVVVIIFVPLVRKSLQSGQSSHAEKNKSADDSLHNPLSPLQLRKPAAQEPEVKPEKAIVPAVVLPVAPVAPKVSAPVPKIPEEIAQDAIIARRLRAPLIKKETEQDSTNRVARAPAQQPTRQMTNYLGGGATAGGSDSLRARLQPLHLKAASAEMLSDPDFTLVSGTPLDCVLIDRIVVEQPGTVSCLITRDVWSQSGRVVLIDKGSKALGHYESGIKQGQTTVFVIWDRLITPKNVDIPLSSPGTGPLGESGLSGYVDNHWWERFGGALMLSIINTGFETATNRSQASGNNQFNFGSSSNNVQSMAAEALKNTINIPPTLYKNQGERINITLAHDIYFGDVYELQRR